MVLTALLAINYFGTKKVDPHAMAHAHLSKLAQPPAFKPKYYKSREPASTPPPEKPPTELASLTIDTTGCELSDAACERGKVTAVKLELFEMAAMLARIQCERSREPCFDAGIYTRKAGNGEQAIFWNVVGHCTKNIGLISCESLKEAGYTNEAFLKLLSLRFRETTVEEILFGGT